MRIHEIVVPCFFPIWKIIQELKQLDYLLVQAANHGITVTCTYQDMSFVIPTF